jgi:chromosome segregation ATPase
MDNGFELLEEKVRKAVELVKKLRQENASLTEDLGRARRGFRDLERKLDALEKQRTAVDGDGQAIEELKTELARLRHERGEIRTRIARMVEALEALD